MNTDNEKINEPQNLNEHAPIIILIKSVLMLFSLIIRGLLDLDVKKKKAISLAVIFIILSVFLDNLNIFYLGRISEGNRFDDYFLFFIMALPAIYLLYLNLNERNVKFKVSLAWLVGMITFRANKIEWGAFGSFWNLSEYNRFGECFSIAAVFSIIALILSYYIKSNDRHRLDDKSNACSGQ